MNQLQIFKNEMFEVGAVLENGEVLFDVEHVAKNLGISRMMNGKEYVRWERVNSYLPNDYPEVGKGDLIPEPMVYKLAFKASNEVAENFQDWLAIEVIPQIRKTGSYSLDITKLSPELQMFNHLFNALANTQIKQQEQGERMDRIEYEQKKIAEVVSLKVDADWKDKVNAIINRIVIARGGGNQYREVRSKSYELLESRAKCRLNVRLENLKKDAYARGVYSPSKIKNFNRMDVIANDTKLTEIYLAIVKEMAIAHRVNVEGLGA